MRVTTISTLLTTRTTQQVANSHAQLAAWLSALAARVDAMAALAGVRRFTELIDSVSPTARRAARQLAELLRGSVAEFGVVRAP